MVSELVVVEEWMFVSGQCSTSEGDKMVKIVELDKELQDHKTEKKLLRERL